MNYLSIAACCQNEGKYIAEWIQYHQRLGVEHFYLYENDSTDDTWTQIKLHSPGLVTARQIHGSPKQAEAYNHCINMYRNATKWMAVIDIDEFLVPKHTLDMHQLLKSYEAYPALVVHWMLFGSNGEEVYTPAPVVERFTRRQSDVNPHVKSIVQPRVTGPVHTVHRFRHVNFAVDEAKRPVEDCDPLPPNGTCNVIQLNHYAVKSRAECMERRSRPRADTGTMRDGKEFFEHHDRNDVLDLRAVEIWRS